MEALKTIIILLKVIFFYNLIIANAKTHKSIYGKFSEILSSKKCSRSTLTFEALVNEYIGYSFDHQYKFTTIDKDLNYFDFIIVGGGSAGCVVANRLSENPNWNVLLLEAGSEEPLISDVPGLSVTMGQNDIKYMYKTQPDPNACGNKSCIYPRGKVLGGCSVLNSMHMTRGHKWDYDNWSHIGNPGWSWSEVLPYFKKSENMKIPEILDKYPYFHGVTGYQSIEGASYYDKNAKVIMDSWKEVGHKEIDYNAGDNLGTSRVQYATLKGARQSSNGAYLRPIRGKRPNLTIRTNSWVTKVIIDSETKEARGVEYKTSDKIKTVYARKEVILSAGSIDTPKILMLSGVGPADNLRESGIEIIKELPVGKNLQDHFSVTPVKITVPNKFPAGNFSLDNHKADLIYWMATHDGPLSINPFMENVAFLKTSFEKVPNVPDIQVGYLKVIYDESSKMDRYLLPYYDSFLLTTLYLVPKSRGEIKLDPKDPVNNQPLIYPNYFSNEEDIKAIAEGARLARQIVNTTAFKEAGFTVSKVPFPLCDHLKFDSYEYYECLVKNNGENMHHQVSTCKMGPQKDPEAVVNARLKVYGISRLRVIDASIMPFVVRGNTHWPTMMIGEKGSDMIKEDWNRIEKANSVSLKNLHHGPSISVAV